ncbi:MAG TPA: NUMOD3 domain-containing DNA-binding protein [Candidatus Nanoarchaeia archaeon]|nr:NUMOD3 domain-containing DNA-binding protein [Candidatus Nanoarchaeia archaeon]
MELIRNLPTRRDKNGYAVSWAVFKCLACLQEVERRLTNGLKQNSCGCVQYKLSSESNKGQKRTEESRQKMRESHLGKKYTEETKKIWSKQRKGENNPMYGKILSEETRQKIREKAIGRKHTEEENRRNSERNKGENNPMYDTHRFGELSTNWQNGKSFEIYPPEFNKGFKQQILERDNYTCQDPNCEHKSNTLDAHHIDYDKKNNIPENVITLCRSCHMKTNGKNKRQYFTEFYQNIMMGKLMECLL